jgi:uroporphyrinogen decarboxylase
MIDCGLDVLQSIQPEAAHMSLAGLRSRFGRALCFHGGISIQRTMPFGTAETVRDEVRAIAETVKPGGGYIYGTAHNIQADTSVRNVLALVEAYHEYGRH